ncbi:MAG: Fic family protein [Heliobacteriaceae bacterium]|jgi:Fic family protein|nr:Fic family protein [Heliobacteriaceae bacterium]
MYIYENKNFPKFTWDKEQILNLLTQVKAKQGYLLGKMDMLGFEVKEKALLNVLVEDVIKSNEIEGQILNSEQVRSSIAKRLGIDIGAGINIERNVEGIVDMMLDASQNYSQPISHERLYSWQAAMFPGGYSGLYKIKTGSYRNDSNGRMQVVSGSAGKEKVHYEAPKAEFLQSQMSELIDYINKGNDDLIIKAGIAHLWFVIIHPFEDGNGRIARALTDMLLARSESSSNRFYSMSSQIKKVRKSYYEILKMTEKSSLEITFWLVWFLENLIMAIENSQELLTSIMQKAEFWQKHQSTSLNERQIKILNKVLDGFEGNLTTVKWSKICNCSQDTAARDIADLMAKGILTKKGEARATHYLIQVV